MLWITDMKILIRLICVFIICFSTLPTGGNAQELTRHEAIAAYIYNFAKNVQWQNEDAIKEFNILIFGEDKNIAQQLLDLSIAKTLRDKPIRVSSSKSLKSCDSAQLIFVTKGAEQNFIDIFDRIEGKNILLVSDCYPDKRLIMINFIESENGTLRFEINKANIINQHLLVMQDIILLGGTEIDVAALYREGQQSLRKLQKRTDDLEGTMKRLESAIAVRTKEIQAQKDSLDSQALKIQKQQKILDAQSQEFKEREKELKAQIQKAHEQQLLYEAKSRELEKQKDDLKKGNEILWAQRDKISRQQTEILSQSKILKKQGTTIHRQKSILYLLLIIIVLIAVLVVTVYRGYKNKQKLNRELELKVAERTGELRSSNEQLSIELAERKRAEKALKDSEAHYRLLFERNPVPMLMYESGSLIILAVNDAFTAHYGYSKAEALALHLTDLYPESEKKAIADLTTTLRGQAYAGEWHHLKKDGTVITIEAHSDGFSFEGRASRIAVITDITKRKRAEAELEDYRRHLEDMVRERTAELAVARDRAEAADRLKSAFLATMSHELRTPLNSIIGFTGIILQGLAGPLNTEQRKQLEMVQNSARHLLALINDVLDISKIEAGQLEVHSEQFDLRASIMKVAGIVKPLAEKKGLDLRLEVAENIGMFMSDPRRVEQVLLNLLNNAIKFTAHGVVTLHAEIVPGSIRISVADTGIGIKPEDLNMLFQPFRQIDSGLTRQHEGTGLGLAICRRLVELLGGEIRAASDWGKGSVFTLILPMKGA
jgi:PAS domain S-box-containing protein